MTERRIPASTIVICAVIDVVLVFVFVVIGRQSHDEGITIGGTMQTVWPFLVGLALGWLLTRAWRRPLGILRPALVIWASTLVLGMLLRLVSGQDIQLPFIIVAAVTLALFLIGWRALAAGLRRIRRTPEAL